MDLRDIIYKKIDEAIGETMKNLSGGHYSHEEYQKACGKISGLHAAFEIIKETYREYLGE